MAENETQTAENNDQNQTQQKTVDTDELGDAGKKALDAERKARRAAEAELKDLTAKVQKLEDRDKTEAERQADQLAQIRTERDEAVARALVLEVAADHGIDSELTRFLPVTSNRDEIEDAAQLLRSKFEAIAGQTGTPRPPAPDPNQGRDRHGAGSTAEQFAAAIEQRFRR